MYRILSLGEIVTINIMKGVGVLVDAIASKDPA
jgi:hypothetical protein